MQKEQPPARQVPAPPMVLLHRVEQLFCAALACRTWLEQSAACKQQQGPWHLIYRIVARLYFCDLCFYVMYVFPPNVSCGITALSKAASPC